MARATSRCSALAGGLVGAQRGQAELGVIGEPADRARVVEAVRNAAVGGARGVEPLEREDGALALLHDAERGLGFEVGARHARRRRRRRA